MRRLLPVLLLLAACGGKPPAQEAAAPPRFSAEAPPGWRVAESQGGAHRITFVGPPEGPAAFSSAVALYFHKKGGGYNSMEEYVVARLAAGGDMTPARERRWKGRRGVAFSSSRTEPAVHEALEETVREETVLIPAEDGFWAVVLTVPAPAPAGAEEAFEKVLETLEL